MGETMPNTNENTEVVNPSVAKSENDAAAGDNDVCVVRRYLGEKYGFRNNVVAGKLEFRLRDGALSAFRLLTFEAGHICRCTIWLRSAVAHCLEMDVLQGNDTVATLMGEQGCGKTVYCRRLLPPSLQQYFLDRMNLSNKFDKDMALTNNMIVVLDALDPYATNQQASPEQALSRSTVNARPIYRGAPTVRHRYASFLATTNHPQPLTDPTGSRRYVCIRIRPRVPSSIMNSPSITINFMRRWWMGWGFEQRRHNDGNAYIAIARKVA